jgi:mRNA interferase MazF
MEQFDIFYANLDPTLGAEIKKTRPVVIISPDEMNDNILAVIVAPITSQSHNKIPTRIPINIREKNCYVVLDQIRTIDKKRLSNFVARLSLEEQDQVKEVLQEMFA